MRWRAGDDTLYPEDAAGRSDRPGPSLRYSTSKMPIKGKPKRVGCTGLLRRLEIGCRGLPKTELLENLDAMRWRAGDDTLYPEDAEGRSDRPGPALRYSTSKMPIKGKPKRVGCAGLVRQLEIGC
jgi:hypothetical protein